MSDTLAWKTYLRIVPELQEEEQVTRNPQLRNMGPHLACQQDLLIKIVKHV